MKEKEKKYADEYDSLEDLLTKCMARIVGQMAILKAKINGLEDKK